jgi:hypothetical protein
MATLLKPESINPLVKESIRRKFHRWVCLTFGCISTGDETGLPQSHCKRCGHKTYAAADHCGEWVKPWGRFT